MSTVSGEGDGQVILLIPSVHGFLLWKQEGSWHPRRSIFEMDAKDGTVDVGLLGFLIELGDPRLKRDGTMAMSQTCKQPQ